MKNLICKKKPADFISVKRFRTDSFSSIKRVLDFVTENFVAKLNYSIIKKNLISNKFPFKIFSDKRMFVYYLQLFKSSVKSCRLIKGQVTLYTLAFINFKV